MGWGGELALPDKWGTSAEVGANCALVPSDPGGSSALEGSGAFTKRGGYYGSHLLCRGNMEACEAKVALEKKF